MASQSGRLMTGLMTLESMFSGFPFFTTLPPQGSKITSEEKSLVPVTDGFLMCEQPETGSLNPSYQQRPCVHVHLSHQNVRKYASLI